MREVQKQRRSHISYAAKPTRRESHSQSGNTCSPRWSIILIMPHPQWPTALNALGPLRDRHALEICNSPHAKAITRRRSFHMGRHHEMCFRVAQRSPSNLVTILSLPLLPQIARSCFFAPTKPKSRGDVLIFYHLHRTEQAANARVHNHYRNLLMCELLIRAISCVQQR